MRYRFRCFIDPQGIQRACFEDHIINKKIYEIWWCERIGLAHRLIARKLLSRQLEKRRKLVWHARSDKLPVNFSSQPRTNVSRIVAPSSGVCARVSAAPRGFNLRHGCDCATRRVSAGSSRFVNSQFCGSPHESNNRASPPRLRPSPRRRLPTPVDWKERKTIVSHRFDAIDCWSYIIIRIHFVCCIFSDATRARQDRKRVVGVYSTV